MYLYYSMQYQGEAIADYTKDLKLANLGHTGMSQEKKRGELLYIKRSYSDSSIGIRELEKFRLRIQAEGSGMAEITEEQFNAV